MDSSSMIGLLLDDGKLRIINIIGSGSFANVYLAESTSLPKRQYAVKSLFKHGLSPKQLELQVHEFRYLQLVSPHSNIVTLHKVIQDDDFLHLVMEFAPNDLFEFVADVDSLDDITIKDMFSQIVSAVKHCHVRGVFHRDLKPENILVVPISTTAFVPKLTDFGLATQDMVSTEFGCGSVRYLAPECLITNSARSYSPAKSDIWALGVILVNLISGKNPWRMADKSDESFASYLQDQRFWNSFGVTPEASTLVQEMLCVDPKHRISLSEVEKRLEKITLFRDTEALDSMSERQGTISTVGTVGMERERRSWNSWASEMSFARPPVFGDAVVPEQYRIQSPVLSWKDQIEDDDEIEYDSEDGLIFPPMSDDEEELFAQVLVKGQVPMFVNASMPKQAAPTKKKKQSKQKPKNNNRSNIDKEPHDLIVPSTNLIIDNPIPNSDPIAIPRNKILIEGDKTPTGRIEASTMTDSNDDKTPPRWGAKSTFLSPGSAKFITNLKSPSMSRTSSGTSNGFTGTSPAPIKLRPSSSNSPPPEPSHGRPPLPVLTNSGPIQLPEPVSTTFANNMPINLAMRTPPPKHSEPPTIRRLKSFQSNRKHAPRPFTTNTTNTAATITTPSMVRPEYYQKHFCRNSKLRSPPDMRNHHWRYENQNRISPDGTATSHNRNRMSDKATQPKWNKYTTYNQVDVSKNPMEREWRKNEDWHPFSNGLVGFGWEKSQRRQRREWKKREIH